MIMSRAAFVQQILKDRSFNIEFHGYLSNHAKHAIIALNRLDAPKSRVEEYWNAYTTLTPYNLELQRVTEDWNKIPPCTDAEWAALRGKKEKWPEMCRFMERELSQRFDGNSEALIAHYAPDLIPGLTCALTHAIIHLGWAIDADSPWMIIEGLAYMNFAFLSVHPENFVHGAFEETSPMESLMRVAGVYERENLKETWIHETKDRYDEDSGFHPELIPAGFQWQVSKVLAHQHEVAYKLPTWLDSMELSELLKELYKAATLLYLGTRDEKDGHGNFLVLHLITSLWGLEHVLDVIGDEQITRSAYKCYYAALVNVLAASSGGFPSASLLERTAERFKDDGNELDSKEAEHLERTKWDGIVERGIAETEEHNIKLVYVCRELWRRYGHWECYLEAGGSFTVTPNIGPSSLSYDDANLKKEVDVFPTVFGTNLIEQASVEQ